MSPVVDDPGSPSHRLCSALRVSTKSKAPPPPSPPLKSLDPGSFSAFPRLAMDHKEDPLDKDLSLVVVLPGGAEKTTTVHGSKPLMDLLVTLCAKYHLNPSGHTLELVTTNRNHIKFKPNTLIGTLEAEKVLLKAKGSEDKNKKAAPHMPEATVRMVINYRRTQKTILRVNPRVPLAELLPSICEKCEFQVGTTVLLRDVQSQGPLDLDGSLNDYAIREVYARDTKDPFCLSARGPPSPSHSVTPGKDKTQKEKENKGLFSMFRRTSKKKSGEAVTASAPASPVLVSKPRPLSMALPSSTADSSPFTDVPKKRRAPQPPLLVSQSCPSDLGVRRRLHSEPTEGRVDGEQMSGLSRGSSTESSLKRTKRKAPAPPTPPLSPGVVEDDTSLDGSSQGGSAHNNNTTLEEIMEQEESTASVTSAALSDAQGDDRSLDLSADVSLDAGSLGAGRDQPGDLSSDGKSVESTMDDSAAHGNTVTSVESSEMTGTESDQVREAKQESTTESATPPSPVRPDMREAQVQVQVQTQVQSQVQAQVFIPANTESLEEASGAEKIAPRPAGEDAQVQTDITLPQVEEAPSSSSSSSSMSPVSGSGSPGTKRDMATLTEERPEPALSRTLDTPPLQASTPQSAPASAKAASVYADDSEPKPKPSNELTRDYIPKVGMTTYTIVPPKSLDKLRYFEVALTLEAPAAPPGEEVDGVSLQPVDGAAREEKPGEVRTEPQTATPREDALMSADTTVSQSLSEPTRPSSTAAGSPTADDQFPSHPSGGGLQGGPTAKVKEVKIPPATKPKPGSFRLPQHKRTPGYYVTSAAVKSLSAGPSTGQKEAPGNPEDARLTLPPPPPPPAHCQGEPAGGGVVKASQEEGDDRSLPVPPVTTQSAWSSKEPTLGLSLVKLRSFAAPRPFSPSTPSRFAQAVSSAVKRSQSQSHGPKSPSSPVSPTFSPIAGHFPIKESKGLPKSKEGDNRKVDGDKGLDGGPDGPLSHGGIVDVGGGENPQQCPDPKNTSTQISTEEPVSLPEPISP